MKITLRITFTNGESITVRTTPLSIMRWEKRTGRSAASLAADYSVTDLILLAYEAARVAGIVVPADPETWAADIDDVDAGADPVVPTDPEPSAG